MRTETVAESIEVLNREIVRRARLKERSFEQPEGKIVPNRRLPGQWVKLERCVMPGKPEQESQGFVWFRVEDIKVLQEHGCWVTTDRDCFQIAPESFKILMQVFEQALRGD